jgi:protein TonB
MNKQVLGALQALGVSGSDDERAVRRAYASRLKEIDAATEPQRFQALRESYELAMAWMAQRDVVASDERQQQPTPVQDISQTPQAPPANDLAVNDAAREEGTGQAQLQRSDDNARAVFEDLMARLAVSGDDRRDVRQALDAALEDPRLLNVDARFLFEFGVASWLANGWRLGHEKVFAPAIGAFQWRKDATSLARLGRAGIIINNAIQELDAYDSLPDATRKLLRGPIRQLRSDKQPGARQLVKSLPVAERAIQSFPHWLHIITNPSNIERWREWETAIPRWRRLVSRMPAQPKLNGASRGKTTSGSSPWTVVLILVGTMGVASSFFQNPSWRAPSPPVASLPPVAFKMPAPPASLSSSDKVNFPPPAFKAPTPAAPAPVTPPNTSAISVQPPFATLPEAKKLVASISKGKADVLKCNDAIRILGAHPKEFEKGTFGRPFDSLMINCLMDKLAVFPYPMMDLAIKREFGRRNANLGAAVRGLPSPASGSRQTPAPSSSNPSSPGFQTQGQ